MTTEEFFYNVVPPELKNFINCAFFLHVQFSGDIQINIAFSNLLYEIDYFAKNPSEQTVRRGDIS